MFTETDQLSARWRPRWMSCKGCLRRAGWSGFARNIWNAASALRLTEVGSDSSNRRYSAVRTLRVPTPPARVGPLSAVLINSLVTQADQCLIYRDNIVIRRNAPRLIAVSPELIGSAHLKALSFKPCDGEEQALAGP